MVHARATGFLSRCTVERRSAKHHVTQDFDHRTRIRTPDDDLSLRLAGMGRGENNVSVPRKCSFYRSKPGCYTLVSHAGIPPPATAPHLLPVVPSGPRKVLSPRTPREPPQRQTLHQGGQQGDIRGLKRLLHVCLRWAGAADQPGVPMPLAPVFSAGGKIRAEARKQARGDGFGRTNWRRQRPRGKWRCGAWRVH